MTQISDQACGSIILLNGASSSGKSSIARELQAQLAAPYYYFSIDHLRDSGVLPLNRMRSGEFKWAEMRLPFFIGFERAAAALAGAGNNLILEYIIETAEWMERLRTVFSSFEVFMVGVHCPLGELERRERQRGDRPMGDARHDFYSVHQHCSYTLEVDATLAPGVNASKIVESLTRWRGNVS